MLKTRSCTAGSNQNIITESEASKMDGSNEAGEASLEKGVKENIETKEKSLQKPTNEKALDTVGESLNSKTDEFQNMLMLDNADDNDDEDEDIELILLLTRNSKSTRKVQLDSYQIKPKKNLQTPMMIKNCQKLKLRKLRIVRKT